MEIDYNRLDALEYALGGREAIAAAYAAQTPIIESAGGGAPAPAMPMALYNGPGIVLPGVNSTNGPVALSGPFDVNDVGAALFDDGAGTAGLTLPKGTFLLTYTFRGVLSSGGTGSDTYVLGLSLTGGDAFDAHGLVTCHLSDLTSGSLPAPTAHGCFASQDVSLVDQGLTTADPLAFLIVVPQVSFRNEAGGPNGGLTVPVVSLAVVKIGNRD
jgi:hypothetical protein